MAKGPSKSKAKSRVEHDLDEYAEETAPKRDVKVIVIGIWFLIVFGLMGAFILTTSQNYNTGVQPETADQNAADPTANIKSLQDAVAKNPNNAQMLMELGFTLLDAGRYQDAAANLQKAAGLASNNADALVGLGMAYQYLNRPNEALAQFDKALQVDPNHDLAKVRKAYFLADAQGDFDGALKLLREVETKQPLGNLKIKLQAQIADYEKKRGK